MNSLKVLSIAAAMSLALAAPTASFAQTKWAGPGGGGKIAVGGGGGFRGGVALALLAAASRVAAAVSSEAALLRPRALAAA